MSLILYTQNNCVFCDVMKQKLAEWDVKYLTVNISEQPEGKEYLKSLGLKTVPQLLIEGHSLNYGIDTREFTLPLLQSRLSTWAVIQRNGGYGDINPNAVAWANEIMEKM